MRSEIRRDISEAAFKDIIVEYARLRGWLVHHQRPAMAKSGRWLSAIQGHAGFPDLVLARVPPPSDGFPITGLVFAELKTEKTGPTDEQKAWLSALSDMEPDDEWRSRGEKPTHQIGKAKPWVYVGLWRPRHWSHIRRVLA